MAENIERNSFIANVNLLVRQLGLLEDVNGKFSDKDVTALAKLSTFDLDVLISDLSKGSYSGSRKLDINLLYNVVGYNKNLTDEELKALWNITANRPAYTKASFTLTTTEVVDITLSSVSNPVGLYNALISSPLLSSTLENTKILLETDPIKASMLRIVDDEAPSNIQSITLLTSSGTAIVSQPNYNWFSTSSSLELIAYNIKSLLDILVKYDDFKEFDENFKIIVDNMDDLNTIVDNMDALLELYAALDSIIINTSDYQAQSTLFDTGKVLTGGPAVGTFGDSIGFDTTPTPSSQNLVRSGGVAEAFNITLTDENASTTLPFIAKGSITSKIQALRNNVKSLFANAIGIGGNPSKLIYGAQGVEGTSPTAARSDHTHTLDQIVDVHQQKTTTADAGKLLTGGTTAGTFGTSVDPATLEKVSNKTLALSAASTDAQYASAKAIFTALSGKVDKVVTADRVYGTDGSGNATTFPKDSFGKVDDVKFKGVSVVTDKVANIPEGAKVLQLSGLNLTRVINGVTNVPKSSFPGTTEFEVDKLIITDAQGTLGIYITDVDANTLLIQTRSISPMSGDKSTLLGTVPTRADLPNNTVAAESLFGRTPVVDDYCRITADEAHAGATTEIYIVSIEGGVITWGNEVLLNAADYQAQTTTTDAGKLLTGGATPGTFGPSVDRSTLATNAALQTLNNKVDGKVGQTSSVDSIYGTDDTGQQTTYPKSSFGAVNDVKVNGTSVITDKVANISVPSLASQLGYDNTQVTENPLTDTDVQGAIDAIIARINLTNNNLDDLAVAVDVSGIQMLYLTGSTLTRALGGTTNIARSVFASNAAFKINKVLLSDVNGTFAVYTSNLDAETLVFTTRTITHIAQDEPTLLGNVATRANLPSTASAAATQFGRTVTVDDYCRILSDVNHNGATTEIYITNIVGDALTWGNEIILNTSDYQAQTTASDSGKVLTGGATAGTYGASLGFDTTPTASSQNLVRSGAIKTALDAKANVKSPTFTETPAAPTATKGTNTTQLATTAFVQGAIEKDVFLTQAQYDALSTADKNNGNSYFIYEEV